MKSDYVMDNIVNNPTKLNIFIWELVVFAFVGLFFGSLIDYMFINISRSLDKTTNRQFTKPIYITIAALQIVFSGLVMFCIWKVTQKKKFALHWQTTIQGLAFPSFFFGIQSNIYSSFQSLYV